MLKNINRNVLRILKQSFTIMLLPHGRMAARQLTLSLSFILFLMFSWTGLTVWATAVTLRQFDYWRLQASTALMRLKLSYFAYHVKKAQEVLDSVREVDGELRTLLGMGSKNAIIQQYEGTGGPTPDDQAKLEKLLAGKLAESTFGELKEQAQIIREKTEACIDSFNEIRAKIEYERKLFLATPGRWPVAGRFTSHYGMRLSPFTNDPDFHPGVDIANARGTPIRAAANGVVKLASYQGGYGNLVVIDHGFKIITRYGHNSRLLVKPGDWVKRGDVIALMGATGNTTGVHCHYEIWYNGKPVNPSVYINKIKKQA